MRLLGLDVYEFIQNGAINVEITIGTKGWVWAASRYLLVEWPGDDSGTLVIFSNGAQC